MYLVLLYRCLGDGKDLDLHRCCFMAKEENRVELYFVDSACLEDIILSIKVSVRRIL